MTEGIFVGVLDVIVGPLDDVMDGVFVGVIFVGCMLCDVGVFVGVLEG